MLSLLCSALMKLRGGVGAVSLNCAGPSDKSSENWLSLVKIRLDPVKNQQFLYQIYSYCVVKIKFNIKKMSSKRSAISRRLEQKLRVSKIVICSYCITNLLVIKKSHSSRQSMDT